MIRRMTLLTLLAVSTAATPLAASAALRPYVATYAVSYGSLSVGESRMELKRDGNADGWLMESHSNAHGLARLVVSSELQQRSWFVVDGASVRPLRYRFDDGDEGEKNVSLDFDWAAGRVTGMAEGKPVSTEAPAGLQDPLSMQVAAALALESGSKLESLPMIEKNAARQYDYVFERREVLDTPLGKLDTLVYRSQRPGNKRYSRLWYAPSLGYVNVRAEQFRESKRLFSLQIKSFQPRN